MITVNRFLPVSAALCMLATTTLAQQPTTPASCLPRGAISGPAPWKSVEVAADGRITFRICAPSAMDVRATSPDIGDAIPAGGNGPSGLVLTRDASGLWSGTTAKPVAPDTYRYGFLLDSAAIADPQATTFSRERTGTQSTLEVPGPSAAFQTYDPKIAHGTVTQIEYWSASLGMKRRAQVYTPPGYLQSRARYPVLYLVHGAGGSDDSWTATGHAHYIQDNLLAAGKARPMIIVMPDGHTPERAGSNLLANNDFGNDLIKDLIPLVDRTFRTNAKASQRAMAGLSMGGAHTIRNGLAHPELFNYLGIFSMGLGNNNQAEVAAYEKDNASALARSAKELKLLYLAMGKDDFLFGTSAPTRAMLDRSGVKYIYNESTGGHTWINWRRYLNDFLPRLFQGR
jgi:enterochelin esterase-like enzyme